MKNILLFSIAAGIIFTSCEDILTKNLELEEFDFEKQMAISGTLSNTDTIFKLLISENQAITTPFGEWEPLEDAEASLYRGETLIGALSYQEDSLDPEGQGRLYELDLENIDITPGDYRIEVSHPDFGDVTAQTEIPEEIEIVEITFEEDYGIGANTLERSDAVLITFNDPPEANYYNISIDLDYIVLDTFIWQGDTSIYTENLYFNLDSNDPNASVGYENITLTDEFFNGDEHTLVVFIVNYSETAIVDVLDHLRVSWSVYSADKYSFDTSLELYYDSTDLGPFSEAVTLYNNIEGGLGYFGGLNKKWYYVE